MKTLNPAFVLEILKSENPYSRFSIEGLKQSYNVIIQRETQEWCKPYVWKTNAIGQKYGGISRRYISLEAALLHCVNLWNENVNVRDRYKTIEEYINDKTI